MRFSVKKIDKSKRLHYTKSVKKIRIHQGGKSMVRVNISRYKNGD